jgi:hypothetical protein
VETGQNDGDENGLWAATGIETKPGFGNGKARPSVFADLSEHILDMDEDVAADELLTIVPIRKPSKKDFIRSHPKHRFNAVIYEIDESREIFYVHPRLRKILTEEEGARTVHLALCTTRWGNLFFWPVTTTTMGSWHASAMTALEKGETRWVKIKSDMELRGYRTSVARADYGEPRWGDHTLEELLEIAFRGRVLDNPDHKVVRHALGEPV